MEVIWQDLAKTQYQNILRYIRGEFGDLVAQSIAIEMLRKIDALGTSPYIARRSRLIQKHEVRELIYKKSVAFYVEHNCQIHVLAICDTRQSPRNMKKMLIKELNKLI